MRYDRDEAVRYMGARKDDREAAVLADTAYLKLRNEVQARSVYAGAERVPCIGL